MTYEQEAHAFYFASIAIVIVGLIGTWLFHDATGSALVHAGALVTVLSVVFLAREYGQRLKAERDEHEKALAQFLAAKSAPPADKQAVLERAGKQKEARHSKAERLITSRYVFTTLLGTVVWGFGDIVSKGLFLPCHKVCFLCKFLALLLSGGSWSCPV